MNIFIICVASIWILGAYLFVSLASLLFVFTSSRGFDDAGYLALIWPWSVPVYAWLAVKEKRTQIPVAKVRSK